MQNRIFSLAFLVAAMLLMLSTGAQFAEAQSPQEIQNAQESEDANSSARKKRRQNAAVVPTAEQQVVIKEFVQEHHPELLELLDRLETRRPAIYTQAIKEVAKSHKRLMNVQKNNPDRYDAALELWKVRSRIHVASARVAINDSPEHRDQLKELVAQQIELRIQQLEFEQARAQQRLQKIQEQRSKFGEEGDSVRDVRIEKESKAAINRIRRLNKMGKKKNGARSGKSGQEKSQQEKSEAGDGSQ